MTEPDTRTEVVLDRLDAMIADLASLAQDLREATARKDMNTDDDS